MNNTRIYLVAALLAACGLAVLLYWSLGAASIRVFSISEVLENASRLQGKAAQPVEAIQIYGRILDIGNDTRFKIILADWENPELSLTVLMDNGYSGPKAAFLRSGQDVFVTGNFVPADNPLSATQNQTELFFAARELITSCPSKYKSKKPPQAQANSPAHPVQPEQGERAGQPDAQVSGSKTSLEKRGSAP